MMANAIAGRVAPGTRADTLATRCRALPWSRLLSAAALLVLWAVSAEIAQSRVLPGPAEVALATWKEALSGDLFSNIAVTLFRVAAAFTFALSAGIAIGYAMGRHKALDRALDVWLVVLLNIPALVIIIMAYIWFGLTEAAAIGAVALNKLPNTIVTIREGARALDPGLDEMAAAFRFDRRKRLVDVVLPQLQPYVAAAARSGLALTWKIVLVVELLGRSNGVGYQMHYYFQLFEVPYILAYALSFVVVMLAIELLILQPLERRANRWRPAHG